MKLTLGGKLSIAIAVLNAASWLILIYTRNESHFFQDCAYYVVFALSIPLARFPLQVAVDQGMSLFWFYAQLFALIPNSFLLGYSTAGVFCLLRRVFQLFRPAAVTGQSEMNSPFPDAPHPGVQGGNGEGGNGDTRI